MKPNKIIPPVIRVTRKKVYRNKIPKIEIDVKFNPKADGESFESKEDCRTDEIEQEIKQEIKEGIKEDGKTFGSNQDCRTIKAEEDGKMFGPKKDASLPTPVQERDRKAIELNTKSKQILFSNFFQIIEKNGDQVTAECKECKAPVIDSITTWFKIRYHLKFHHPEMYQKYKNEVHQSKPLYIEAMDELSAKANFKKVLFKNYFQKLSKIESDTRTRCKLCESILKCSRGCTSLPMHLKVKHPDIYTKYQEEVKQCRYEPDYIGDENEIEIEFKEESKRILSKNYYKIIAKNENVLTAVCRTCKCIVKSSLNGLRNFRLHLLVYHQDVYKKYKNEVYLKRYPKANERNQKRNQKNQTTHSTTQILLVKPFQINGKIEDEWNEVKNAEIHGIDGINRYSAEIERLINNNMDVVVKTRLETVEKPNQPYYLPLEPHLKNRLNSKTLSDEEMLSVVIKSDHSYATANSEIEKVKKKSIVAKGDNNIYISEDDASDWIDGSKKEHNDDRQELEVEIVKLDVDPDGTSIEKPKLYDEHGNRIFEKNVLPIELNQDANDEIKENALATNTREDEIENEFKTDSKEVLFGNYYHINEVDGNMVTAECKSCESILNDSVSTCYKLRYHLKKHHVELFEKYQTTVQQTQFYDFELMDGNSIAANFKQVLFQNYFQKLSNMKNDTRTLCKMCKSILNDSARCTSLMWHLKHQHPEEYTKYQEEVKQGSFEPDDVGDENEIEVEFEEKSDRILFKDYYKVIAINEDDVTAVCRTCHLIAKSSQNSFRSFRFHLQEQHPNVYETYKNQVRPKNSRKNEGKSLQSKGIVDHGRILLKNYFQLIKQNGINLTTTCRFCDCTVRDSRRQRKNLRKHLRKNHCEIYEKYKKEAMLGKYQKDIKIKFKTFAARTLFENFRIIEKKEEQVRVVCKHCELVLKGSLYERAVFRSHLKRRHAKIHKKYSKELKHHMTQNPNVIQKTTVNIVQNQNQPVYNTIEDMEIGEETSSVPIDFEHSYATGSEIDKKNEESIVGEMNMNGLDVGIEQGPNCEWPDMEVEIVAEEGDLDEFMKEAPQFHNENENKINESNIKDDQEANAGTLGIKEGELVYATEIEFNTNSEKIIFGNYYQIIEINGNHLTVECKNCKEILKDSVLIYQNIRSHMKVCMDFLRILSSNKCESDEV